MGATRRSEATMDGVSPRPDKPGISRRPQDVATRGESDRIPWIGFAFDYVDPGSYLAAELLLRRVSSGFGVRVDWYPLELRVPPARPLNPRDPAWHELFRGVARQADKEGIEMVEPATVPWTRKAHELAFLARGHGRFGPVHRAIFAAHFRDARDIGRTDVLVALAAEHGLDPALTRTVLGTDTFSAAVSESAERLRSWGVRGVPTLWTERARLEGLQSVASFDSFLTGVEAEAPRGNTFESERNGRIREEDDSVPE
jgi:predicted DsbA family dithiol-disulfide isomerase